MTTSQERRYAGFYIPYPFLLDTLMKEGIKLKGLEVIKGIPKDAKFVTSYREDASMQIIFVFEHPSFESISIGASVSLVNVEYKVKYDNSL